MQEEIKRVDPLNDSTNTGILGRISDVLDKKNFNVNSFAIDTGELQIDYGEKFIYLAMSKHTGFDDLTYLCHEINRFICITGKTKWHCEESCK